MEFLLLFNQLLNCFAAFGEPNAIIIPNNGDKLKTKDIIETKLLSDSELATTYNKAAPSKVQIDQSIVNLLPIEFIFFSISFHNYKL